MPSPPTGLRPASPGTAAFAAALTLAPRSEPAPGSLLGLEHEYSLALAGQPVDFRELIHSLPIDGLRIDPADINAYRCANGMALTCDEAEAEVASPPMAVAPGFAADLAAWATSGRSMLEDPLPPVVRAAGYSTHISVSMPNDLNDEVCGLFIQTFGPAVALVLEGPGSLGIYVRPRPGRLEVCGEFVEGARLGAAAALVAGGARACAAAVTGQESHLPPLLDCRLLAGIERYGLRLHRHSSFGFDYYAAGRAAELPLAKGGTIAAQALIECAWAAARSQLASAASEADLAAMDAIVARTLPLGVEGGFPFLSASRLPVRSPFCELAKPRRRGALQLDSVAATWETAIVRAASETQARYVTVPRAQLGEFFAGLDSGLLDEPFARTLATAAEPAPRSPVELRTFGVYSTAPDPALLIPAEREPNAALGSTKAGRAGKFANPASARPGKAVSARPFKFVTAPLSAPAPASQTSAPSPSPPPPPLIPIPPAPPAQPEPSSPPAPPPLPPESPPWRPSPLAVILVAGAAAIAIAVGALAVVYDGGSGGEPTPTATTTPAATATASVAAVVSTPSPTPPTASPSVTPKPVETVTPPASPSATATKVSETITPGAGPTGTPAPSATARPTDSVPATLTPSPSPTPTKTATATPTRTATRAPTPTLPVIIVATATPVCTPSPGTACPTPIP